MGTLTLIYRGRNFAKLVWSGPAVNQPPGQSANIPVIQQSISTDMTIVCRHSTSDMSVMSPPVSRVRRAGAVQPQFK